MRTNAIQIRGEDKCTKHKKFTKRIYTIHKTRQNIKRNYIVIKTHLQKENERADGGSKDWHFPSTEI